MIPASITLPIAVILSYFVSEVSPWLLSSYRYSTTPTQHRQHIPHDRNQNIRGVDPRNLPLYSWNVNDENNNDEEWSDFDDLGYKTDDLPIRNSSNSKEPPKYVPQIDDIVVDSTSTTSDLSDVDFAKLLQEKQQQLQQQQQQGTTRSTEKQPTTKSSSSNKNLYIDYTAIQTRQFSLGQDIVLSDYVGTMGFQEVTDWEYYYPEDDDDDDDGSNILQKKTGEPLRRQVVQPNPFDPSKYVAVVSQYHCRF